MFASGQVDAALEEAHNVQAAQLQTVVGDIASMFRLGSEAVRSRALRAVAERSPQQEQVGLLICLLLLSALCCAYLPLPVLSWSAGLPPCLRSFVPHVPA